MINGVNVLENSNTEFIEKSKIIKQETEVNIFDEIKNEENYSSYDTRNRRRHPEPPPPPPPPPKPHPPKPKPKPKRPPIVIDIGGIRIILNGNKQDINTENK